MNEQDKSMEISLGNEAVNGTIKFKNMNNRVIASIGDIVVDKLSYFRWNNAVKFLDKYNKKKQKRSLEGKETPLPPKFIIEILDNAIQENDETIQDQWCNLIINWQDIEKNCDSKYMYIDILKNLTLNEIRFLKLISQDSDLERNVRESGYYYDKNKIISALKITEEEYELMILNLFRLKVCDSLKSSGSAITVDSLPVLADAGIDKIRITIIGFNLIKSIED